MYSAGTALSPTDCVVNKESSYGSFEAEPVVTDDVIIFIQRLQRTLRSISYDYYRDAYLGPELTLFAESLTQQGISKVVYKKEPYSIRRRFGRLPERRSGSSRLLRELGRTEKNLLQLPYERL